MFKSYLLSFLLILASPSMAAGNRLLQCLAKEEERLHKAGPPDALFRLNQEFVNELASANDITLKNNYIDEICSAKKHSPSVGLLRLLILKENEIYDLSLSGVESSMRPFKMGYINEFQKQVPRLFFSYLSGIQSEMAGAHCLSREIPELAELAEKLKYLEEELSTHQILKDKRKLEIIFKKLEDTKGMKARCKSYESKRVQKKKNTRL